MATTKQLSKHTPGPWVADPELRLSNGGSLAVTRLNPDGSHLVIAEVWKTNDRIPLLRDDNAAQANARLIAKAPKMLELLERLATFNEWYKDDNCLQALSEEAEALIA